jgi:hypothetical protein
MRHEPSFQLTLRLSEQTTPADRLFAGKRPKQKLVIDGARNVPQALFDRAHSPRHAAMDYEVNCQRGTKSACDGQVVTSRS